eukprot:gnl/TRDRNA2_/TRDRNA2_174228_c7_seq12.p1 gnl/TRDRNA2_/TRDRNA2_174228_c7~~gnl/TRDRNA2_/TRDRNA2_174228_c7_seq12.p1  ORF type:complete len:847 (+),score=133.75 gnl/TRDRNA2_/TRDRNA2_174228_c7_seq12:43-2541(+)
MEEIHPEFAYYWAKEALAAPSVCALLVPYHVEIHLTEKPGKAKAKSLKIDEEQHKALREFLGTESIMEALEEMDEVAAADAIRDMLKDSKLWTDHNGEKVAPFTMDAGTLRLDIMKDRHGEPVFSSRNAQKYKSLEGAESLQHRLMRIGAIKDLLQGKDPSSDLLQILDPIGLLDIQTEDNLLGLTLVEYRRPKTAEKVGKSTTALSGGIFGTVTGAAGGAVAGILGAATFTLPVMGTVGATLLGAAAFGTAGLAMARHNAVTAVKHSGKLVFQGWTVNVEDSVLQTWTDTANEQLFEAYLSTSCRLQPSQSGYTTPSRLEPSQDQAAEASMEEWSQMISLLGIVRETKIITNLEDGPQQYEMNRVRSEARLAWLHDAVGRTFPHQQSSLKPKLVVKDSTPAETTHRALSVTIDRLIRDLDRTLYEYDLYCVCEIKGKKNAKFKTPVVPDSFIPEWRYVDRIDDYATGDELSFELWHKDDDGGDKLFGRAILASAQFDPSGFEGDLDLFDKPMDLSYDKTTLKVKVAFVDAVEYVDRTEAVALPVECFTKGLSGPLKWSYDKLVKSNRIMGLACKAAAKSLKFGLPGAGVLVVDPAMAALRWAEKGLHPPSFWESNKFVTEQRRPDAVSFTRMRNLLEKAALSVLDTDGSTGIGQYKIGDKLQGEGRWPFSWQGRPIYAYLVKHGAPNPSADEARIWMGEVSRGPRIGTAHLEVFDVHEIVFVHVEFLVSLNVFARCMPYLRVRDGWLAPCKSVGLRLRVVKEAYVGSKRCLQQVLRLQRELQLPSLPCKPKGDESVGKDLGEANDDVELDEEADDAVLVDEKDRTGKADDK